MSTKALYGPGLHGSLKANAALNVSHILLQFGGPLTRVRWASISMYSAHRPRMISLRFGVLPGPVYLKLSFNCYHQFKKTPRKEAFHC